MTGVRAAGPEALVPGAWATTAGAGVGEHVVLPCTGIVVVLRELTGADERTATGTSTAAALALLDRLVVGAAPPAATLPSADRDRLLLAAHRRAFGDRVEATLTCCSCGDPFDLDFTLTALDGALLRDRDRTPADEHGHYRASGVGVFRLPTGRDELAVADLEPKAAAIALQDGCVVDAGPDFDADTFQRVLDDIAPLADLDLDAPCPGCGNVQQVHFDIQDWFLSALVADRPRLLADVHRLATAYHWSPRDILGLPRGERRELVTLVEADAATAVGRRWT
ncbi:hypothetical protein ABZ016_19890 [Streptomyces sp. NPDC006372]|uniref:hypothetical protein n=1 Tax=Streptomyces sp. NPDC006372 TaxID=3155599 RepID=UPI0033B2FCF8